MKSKCCNSDVFIKETPKAAVQKEPVAPVVPANVIREEVQNKEEEEEKPTQAVASDIRKAYTFEDLTNPALDGLEKHVDALLNLASPKRKAYFENKKLPNSPTLARSVLRTLIDYFEIDVHAVIAAAKKS